MDYDVEELARLAGVRVDTIRFYQAKGLLPRPRREGRRAVYSAHHLARLRRIRSLQDQGLPLDVIRRLHGERRAAGALARALRAEQGSRSLTRSQLAAESGVPEALIRAVEEAGILEPVRVGPDVRYTDADVELARAALALLGEDLPLPDSSRSRSTPTRARGRRSRHRVLRSPRRHGLRRRSATLPWWGPSGMLPAVTSSRTLPAHPRLARPRPAGRVSAIAMVFAMRHRDRDVAWKCVALSLPTPPPRPRACDVRPHRATLRAAEHHPRLVSTGWRPASQRRRLSAQATWSSTSHAAQ